MFSCKLTVNFTKVKQNRQTKLVLPTEDFMQKLTSQYTVSVHVV